MLNKYQNNYASIRPQMYDEKSREQKAVRIVKTLEDYYRKNNLKNLTVLDVGASTGIIDSVLAKHFKKVVGTDIDKDAINFAKMHFKKKNLIFKVEDAMKLSFKEKSFDIVICTHVYEHVPNVRTLFREIERVLKPNGVCYLAAQNKYWPIEAHHNLPFLSYLPKKCADFYIRLFSDFKEYYEHPMSYWQLKSMLRKKFTIFEYTDKIVSNHSKYGYYFPKYAKYFSIPAKYFSPTFIWLLRK